MPDSASDAELVRALQRTLDAWDALPMGHHAPAAVERWLTNEIGPTIPPLRELLSRTQAETGAWRPIETAPKDGTPILVCRHNGVFHDYYVVWWSSDLQYPWQSDANRYVEDLFDAWQPLPTPPEASS